MWNRYHFSLWCSAWMLTTYWAFLQQCCLREEFCLELISIFLLKTIEVISCYFFSQHWPLQWQWSSTLTSIYTAINFMLIAVDTVKLIANFTIYFYKFLPVSALSFIMIIQFKFGIHLDSTVYQFFGTVSERICWSILLFTPWSTLSIFLEWFILGKTSIKDQLPKWLVMLCSKYYRLMLIIILPLLSYLSSNLSFTVLTQFVKWLFSVYFILAGIHF